MFKKKRHSTPKKKNLTLYEENKIPRTFPLTLVLLLFLFKQTVLKLTEKILIEDGSPHPEAGRRQD